MGPLRLVLSPADMAAIFINLEVRSLAFFCHICSCLALETVASGGRRRRSWCGLSVSHDLC